MDFLLSLSLLTNHTPTAWALSQDWDHPLQALVVVKEVPVRLSEAEIQQHMEALPPAWTTDGETLFYEQTFEDFVAAIAFVNALVVPAEALGHHPEITIRYNRVALELTTHDAGGLTDLDFQLAEQISQL